MHRQFRHPGISPDEAVLGPPEPELTSRLPPHPPDIHITPAHRPHSAAPVRTGAAVKAPPALTRSSLAVRWGSWHPDPVGGAGGHTRPGRRAWRPGHARPDHTAGLLGFRAELAWLGRAEQASQDAADEIWVAACEFLGVR